MHSDRLTNPRSHIYELNRLNDSSWVRSGVIVIALLLLPFGVFWAETLGQQVFYHHDLQYYFFPYHKLVADITASGYLPLWNPYAFSGIPLLGDGQTALLYPPNWLFWLLPPAHALTLGILLHFSIAGVGTFAFVRALRLSRLAASTAALAFMFNGYLVARVVHPSIMAGAALVPLIFWSVERLLQRGGGRAFVVAAAMVALQLLAGHPQIPIYTGIGLGAYVLAIVLQQAHRTRRRHELRALVRVAGAYLAGYALAAVQILPWVEFGAFSPRAAGASYELMAAPIAGLDWLLFLFPYGYGGMESSWLQSDPTWSTAIYVWERLAYIGLLPLALAGVGLAELRRYSRLARRSAAAPDQDSSVYFHYDRLQATILLLIVVLLIAMGSSTPAGRLIYLLPAVGKLRNYLRAIGVVCFPLVVLAAYGVERLQLWRSREPRRRDRAPIWSGLALLGAVGGVLILANVAWSGTFDSGRPAAMDAQMPGRFLQIGQANAYVPLALSVASALVLCWLSSGFSRAKTVVLLGVIGLDMVGLAVTFNPTTGPEVFERVPPGVAFLRRDPALFRVANFIDYYPVAPDLAQDQLAISWAIAYGVEDINGFNSLQPRRYTDFLYSTQVEDVSYGFLNDEALLRPQSHLLSMLNVKYALVQQPSPIAPDPSWTKVFSAEDVAIYRNPAPLGRAYFVDQVTAQSDPRQILERIKQPDFQPWRQAFVETDQAPAAQGIAQDSPARVDVTRVSPNELRIDTQTSADRFLVLSEMWFPGWHAEVDGRDLPIYRTDYLFRGLVVPAGQHTIRMYYRPTSVLLGALLSASMVIACLVVWAKGSRPT